jgi:hypothetical protein
VNAIPSLWQRPATPNAVDPDFTDVLLAHDDELDICDMPLDDAWPYMPDAFFAARLETVEMTVWGNPASGEPINAYLEAEPDV